MWGNKISFLVIFVLLPVSSLNVRPRTNSFYQKPRNDFMFDSETTVPRQNQSA